MKSEDSQNQGDIRWFQEIGIQDVWQVGGKNASLGEMLCSLSGKGIRVPNGFATTAKAYRDFLRYNNLSEQIQSLLENMKAGQLTLADAGHQIRNLILKADFCRSFAESLGQAYLKLSQCYHCLATDVAVRSSATAEDLPEASFAGQQETFLNVSSEAELLEACKKCFASLFTDRAIAYRERHGFDHMSVALSVGVQKMVRSDKAGSGVMFSLDTETGFQNVVVINAAWGLGENVVQGTVNPDEYLVFKPLLNQDQFRPVIEKDCGNKEQKMIYADNGKGKTQNIKTTWEERKQFVLNDDEILQLGRWACVIEAHYGKPMDMEWAKDGNSGEIFIVQARPETVQSRKTGGRLKKYTLEKKGRLLVEGLSIGEAIRTGEVSLIESVADIDNFREGTILVTVSTDPDWVPIMKKAAGIITDQGGRTCHAAIVSRELGVPAIVGTNDATHLLKDGQKITLSCAEGYRGYVYEGILPYREEDIALDSIPDIRTRIMLNLANPDTAFNWWKLPSRGVGLARMEFIINNMIKIHPMALIQFDTLKDPNVRRQIQELTYGYPNKKDYFVERLALGIAKIAAAQYPEPAIVRMSDFKTNEYANLIGGQPFEPHEENPMIGFRGASRYYSERYREGFALECQAIKKVREIMGLTNVYMMIPFCRTLEEADRVLEVLAQNGLRRGENDLQIYVMCEIPSNVLLAEQFSDRFDGFSIGSNDLTQLVLGVDRDSAELAHLFDERNEAVKMMIRQVIREAHKKGRKVGICGQAPSDYPDFAAFLVEEGIDSISLNPDSVISVVQRIAQVE